MPQKVSSFVVLDVMSARNKDIRLAPMENILRVQKTKAGTQVTIGVGGDVVAAIANGKFLGGLILADRDEFAAIEAELESEPGTPTGEGGR